MKPAAIAGGARGPDPSRIDCLGIDRVLQRGTGEIIEERPEALFVRDAVSGAYFLVCEDAAAGLSLLDRHAGRGIDLLMASNAVLGRVSKMPEAHFQRLELHFCVDFP